MRLWAVSGTLSKTGTRVELARRAQPMERLARRRKRTGGSAASFGVGELPIPGPSGTCRRCRTSPATRRSRSPGRGSRSRAARLRSGAGAPIGDCSGWCMPGKFTYTMVHHLYRAKVGTFKGCSAVKCVLSSGRVVGVFVSVRPPFGEELLPRFHVFSYVAVLTEKLLVFRRVGSTHSLRFDVIDVRPFG